MNREAAVENVVEQQNMAAPHIGHLGLPEVDLAGCLRAVIAGDAPAIDLERMGNPPQEVGHENKTAVQQSNDRQFFPFVVFGDLAGEFVQTGQDRGLMVEDAGDVGNHGGGRSGGFRASEEFFARRRNCPKYRGHAAPERPCFPNNRGFRPAR